jgi:hypothetical protein
MKKRHESSESNISPEGLCGDEVQLTYAKVLDVGGKIGFVVLLLLFLLYLSGMVPGLIPIRDLPRYWGMKAGDFNAAVGVRTGWHWLSMLGKGDYLTFIGIAILAGLSIACQASICPLFVRRRDWIYLAIGVAQVLVLLLAASGVLKGGAG